MKWDCKLDLSTMRAQIALAFFVLIIFAVLLGATLWIVGMKRIELTGAALTLITTGLTATITQASTVISYFFNRHRPQSPTDNDGDTTPLNPSQPENPAK